MAVDFSKLLSSEQRARMAAANREIARLFMLPDRFLGRALLLHARNAAMTHQNELAVGKTIQNLLHNVVPEIAARLGETQFLSHERSVEFRQATTDELRSWVWWAVSNAPTISPSDKSATCAEPYDILTHSIPNGNPLAFAADRICPPNTLPVPDSLAKAIIEVSRARGFDPPLLGWVPAMQDVGRFKKKHSIGVTDRHLVSGLIQV